MKQNIAINNKLNDFEKALEAFQDALQKSNQEKKSENFEFFRDSAIQRFEFCYEYSWKIIKVFLQDIEGIYEAQSPRSSIKLGYKNSYIKNLETWYEMIIDRNKTSHEYGLQIANDIFEDLDSFYTEMIFLYENLRKKYSENHS